MPKKAIVIDDSRAIRKILARSLASSGFEVVEAANGREALDCLEFLGCEPVELALVDWNMPEMNGLEFVRAVRRERAYDALCLIMVTTETETSQMVRALAAGANEYLMKPFSHAALEEKLELMGLGGAGD